MTARPGAVGTTVTSNLSFDSDQIFVAQADFDGAGELSFDAEIPSTGVAYSGEATFAGTSELSANGALAQIAQIIFAGDSAFSVDAFLPVTVEFLRPDADDLDGGWTNELEGTNLFPSIDEASFDDADYIKSSADPSADVARFRMSDPTTGVSEPAKIRIRYKRTGAGPIDLTVRLKQGGTEVASWVYSGIADTFVTTTETLTAPQFAAITDFSDLFIELQAN